MITDQRMALETALVAVGLPAEASELLAVEEGGEPLASRLAVNEVAIACVGAALVAAGALHESRGGAPAITSLDADLVRAAVRSERYFAIDGREPSIGFAPLSRFWAAADGWVRTHANFSWHREALLRAVGVKESDGEDLADAVADGISCFGAADLEERVFARGGVAAAVRSAAEWEGSAPGRAVAAEPLIAAERFDGAGPRQRPPALAAGGAPAPAAGVRVLDLTRVIAGPVGSRYLGALGAEVLRLDPPERPDLPPGAPFDTLLGKRSAFLDFTSPTGRERLEALLGGADVVLLGYRPGALERFGLAPADLAARHPGVVIVQLAAWGHAGPWSERRGFDSIVQAASGIAAIEADAGGAPGALPCQLLDHGTGYLVAAAALDALREQEARGGSHVRRLSLARTAGWLLDQSAGCAVAASVAPAEGDVAAPDGSGAGPAVEAPDSPSLDGLDSPLGRVHAVPPPGAIDSNPLVWPRSLSGYGDDAAEWR
jgi:crotonobetainyl-CoA:carnitine CoA-transferase CaiB-like acyl-CoA transferase